MAPSRPLLSRRESNLTLDEDPPLPADQLLHIEPPETPTPWMTLPLFHSLWASATHAVRGSCSFTVYRPRLTSSDTFISRRRPSRRESSEVEDSFLAVAAAMDEDEQLDFQDQLLQCLGEDIVILPDPAEAEEEEEEEKRPRRSLASTELQGDRVFVVYAYISIVVPGKDDSSVKTVLLLRVEQLHGSEQLAIAVKNTDPVDVKHLEALLKIIQQRLQPGSAPPRRPPPPRGLYDAASAFLEGENEEYDDVRSNTETDGDDFRSPVQRVSIPDADSAVEQTPSSRRSSGPTRSRSHTIRYRSEKGIAFEGYLHKKSELLDHWRATYCVLEGDTLAYYESREDFISNVKLIGRIQVQSVHEHDRGSTSTKPHSFRVVTEGHRVHQLSSRTAFEKDQWKRAIQTAIVKATADSTTSIERPHVAFASQSLDPTKFYRLFGALLRQEINEIPLLFRCIHPDVVLTSNFPPIVPFWGQYRRYDGLLLFISTLLESVIVESLELVEVIDLVRGDADCVDSLGDDGGGQSVDDIKAPPHAPTPSRRDSSAQPSPRPLSDLSHAGTDSPSLTPTVAWEKRLVVTGKETYKLINLGNRRVTQLFVHELWLDYKGRLVRWHMNGDAVALSVAFDGASKGENIRLVLPGESTSIAHEIPPGVFYVQILRAQQLTPAETSSAQPTKEEKSTGTGSKRLCPVYARCILQDGPHQERTLDGLESTGSTRDDSLKTKRSSTNILSGLSASEKRRPSASTRLFRGLKRAAGLSGERTFAAYGDASGCVTSICKCPAQSSQAQAFSETLRPEWCTHLRLEFPGCARGHTYCLKLEVFQSRFMLPDALLGVCKINLTPHLALFNGGSAEAKANGALPRWHNLCDQYNDCRESWAPPTVFRGRIQVAVIFSPTITSVDALHDPKIQGSSSRRSSTSSLTGGDSRRASAKHNGEDALLLGSNEMLRELLRGDKDKVGNGGSLVSRVLASTTARSSSHQDIEGDEASESPDERHEMRLRRDNHTFNAKKTQFDIPTKYQLIKVVGAGTYGEVIAASDTDTGTTVAIKKVTNAFADLPDTKRILRELCLLRQLNHPNLIRLYDVLRPERLSYLEDIYLVTDLMETDLHRVVHSAQTLTDEHVAYFMRQILRALSYVHSANILHRDLKPSNILVTSACDLKICDLGLARYVDYSQANKTKNHQDDPDEDAFVELTEYVVTRWYRAPEILLDGCRYEKPSDLWSTGCILAELLGRKPLFPGTSTTNQLHKIFNVLGTPDIVYIAKIHKEAAQRWVHRQKRRAKIPFSELYPSANALALDLLDKLLVYDPKKRLTAAQALRHPYLKEAFRSISMEDDVAKYNAQEEQEDLFQGDVDDSHERVKEEKSAMQDAVFEQICHFHPEAREYEEILKLTDQQFAVDKQTGKLKPIAV